MAILQTIGNLTKVWMIKWSKSSITTELILLLAESRNDWVRLLLFYFDFLFQIVIGLLTNLFTFINA